MLLFSVDPAFLAGQGHRKTISNKPCGHLKQKNIAYRLIFFFCRFSIPLDLTGPHQRQKKSIFSLRSWRLCGEN